MTTTLPIHERCIKIEKIILLCGQITLSATLLAEQNGERYKVFDDLIDDLMAAREGITHYLNEVNAFRQIDTELASLVDNAINDEYPPEK